MKTYLRVIPRDLFNEANHLKCLGQLYLLIERHNFPDVSLDYEDGMPFNILQYEDDGSTYCTNVTLTVRGRDICLYRPINSRYPWPLYFMGYMDVEGEVFDKDGELSAEMLHFLKGTET